MLELLIALFCVDKGMGHITGRNRRKRARRKSYGFIR